MDCIGWYKGIIGKDFGRFSIKTFYHFYIIIILINLEPIIAHELNSE
jgi:hypothetical protein